MIFRKISENDLKEIEAIFQENIESGKLLEKEPKPLEEAWAIVRYEDLPPNGKKENLHNYLIQNNENTTIGLLSYYCGYPEENFLYIGSLFIRPKYQGQGFGKIIFNEIEKYALENEFTEIRLGVGLKNWGAIDFWFKCGFTQITKFSGDKIFSDETFAVIELMKKVEKEL